MLHQLVDALRHDYVNHAATTKRVRSGRLGTDWGMLIGVLTRWGVFDSKVSETYKRLEVQRHASVHFDPTLDAAAREPALEALLALQMVIEAVFAPHGGPPRCIADTVGGSYIALSAETQPLIKRIFIPRCALVSPNHRLEATTLTPVAWAVFDDADTLLNR